MQGKGLIKFIALVLLLVSIYNLVFTWKADQIEKQTDTEAVAYAESLGLENPDETKAKKREYEQILLDSLYEEKVFLNMFTYKQIKKQALKRGLDLKGGMSVVVEADIPNLLTNLTGSSQNANFLAAIKNAKEAQKSSQADYVDLFIDSFQGTDQELVGLFQNADNDEDLGLNSGKNDLRTWLKGQAKDAFDSAYDVIQTRIYGVGLEQPTIQRQDVARRILIEIPGVENPARVRELIVTSANLEFYEVYEGSEFVQFLSGANEAVKNHLILTKPEIYAQAPTVDEPSEPDTNQADDDEDPSSVAEILEGAEEIEDPDQQNAEDINKDFPLFSVLQPISFRSNIIGVAEKKDTSLVNEYLSYPGVQESFPPDAKIAWGSKAEVEENEEEGTSRKVVYLYALRTQADGSAFLDGSMVKTARQGFKTENNEPNVLITMNSEGGSIWSDMTARNEGKYMAIALDDQVYSAPVSNGRIPSGSNTEISGSFGLQEAKDLATVLKTGKLDVPAKIIEEEVVGPTIGGKNARNGVLSLVAGILLVLVFMWFYYGKAGLIADIALVFNLILVIGILAAFGATLTLPGIAGLVLTIGMAVDANVIIFERIREELRKGTGLSESVKKGYGASYSAIIDANLTTLIIAAILYGFGIGPIKGFAIVLIIGIFTSLFTGVLFTRVIKDDLLKKGKSISYWTGISKDWLSNINFDFIGKRKIAYIVSGIIVLASLLNVVVRQGNAFDLGVDLSSGRSYTVRFDQDVDVNEVESLVDAIPNTSNVVRTFGGDNQLKITTNLLTDDNSPEIDKQAEQMLFNALQPVLGDIDIKTFKESVIQSSQKVDSSIADDLRKQSVLLTVLSLIFIFLYLTFRFLKWQFGVAAVVTLAHDTLVILAAFSFLRGILPFALEIDQAFIAALLTVIGYSINDTVVVFDRIREELALHPKKDYKEVINSALNFTFSRTLITSLTTFFVIFLLFIFGGDSIRGFAFALLIGIIVGTYSSLFVATPIVVDLYAKGKAAIPAAKKKKKKVKPVTS